MESSKCLLSSAEEAGGDGERWGTKVLAIWPCVDAARRAAGLAAFNRFLADWVKLTEIAPSGLHTGAVLLDTHTLALRAGDDALHVAIVRRLRASLATLDARQSFADELYDVAVFDVS